MTEFESRLHEHPLLWRMVRVQAQGQAATRYASPTGTRERHKCYSFLFVSKVHLQSIHFSAENSDANLDPCFRPTSPRPASAWRCGQSPGPGQNHHRRGEPLTNE